MLARIRRMVSLWTWKALYVLGVHHLFRWLNRRRVLIVMYHGVVPDGRPDYNWGQLAESKFRWQLEYLRRHYRIARLGDVARAMRDGKPVPPGTAVITFDDGFENNATVACRHLRELGMPATIFLVTGRIGTDQLLWPDELYLRIQNSPPQSIDLSEFGLGALTIPATGIRWPVYVDLLGQLKSISASQKDAVMDRIRESCGCDMPAGAADDYRLMSWEQVEELRREGLVRFGAHSLTHEILTSLPPDDATHQMIESCREVLERTGQPDVAFAFPNGSPADFSEFLKKVLRIERTSCAVTTLEGLNAWDADVHSLKRISVGADSCRSRFALKCSGFIPMLRMLAAQFRGDSSAAAIRPSLPRTDCVTDKTEAGAGGKVALSLRDR